MYFALNIGPEKVMIQTTIHEYSYSQKFQICVYFFVCLKGQKK